MLYRKVKDGISLTLKQQQGNKGLRFYLGHYTVDMERFTGQNICGFNPIEVFMEILSCWQLPWLEVLVI